MKLYSYNKCGTCRKAKKLLDAYKTSYNEIDITENPPPKSVLKKVIKVKGIKKLFNINQIIQKHFLILLEYSSQ